MFDQTHFSLNALYLGIAKQQAMLDELSTHLHSLADRLDAVSAHQKRANDSVMALSKALEQMNTQLTESVEESARMRQGTNMTFGVATACLMQHREGLEQVGAVVRELMDRVAAMELQQQRAARAARVQGASAKPLIKLERSAGPRPHGRKKPFSRPGADKRV